jgi:hypothetical protein
LHLELQPMAVNIIAFPRGRVAKIADGTTGSSDIMCDEVAFFFPFSFTSRNNFRNRETQCHRRLLEEKRMLRLLMFSGKSRPSCCNTSSNSGFMRQFFWV